MTAIEFQFEPSAPDLAPYVVGFAERRDAECFGDALELPLLNPLLQFFIRGDYRVGQGAQGPFEAVPRVALWGTTGAAMFARHAQSLHVFVVILTNLGLARLTGVRPAELADRRTAFADVWPREPHLLDQIEAAGSFSLRIKAASAWLRALQAHPNSADAPILSLADSIADGESFGTVDAVAARAGLPARSLRRNFEKIVGRAPKETLRIARLQRVIRQLHPHPWRRADRRDALLEYFDDSHCARDFAQLTTLTPRQFVLAKRRTGDPLVNTVCGLR